MVEYPLDAMVELSLASSVGDSFTLLSTLRVFLLPCLFGIEQSHTIESRNEHITYRNTTLNSKCQIV